jgi:hypothetical protein
MSTDTESIYSDFGISYAGRLLFQCALGAAQQIGTSVISSFTAKNYAGVTPAGIATGLNEFALSGITLAYNELVVDTTHPANFWPYWDFTTAGGAPGSGDTWGFSQPLVGYFSAGNYPTEVTLVSGDAITVYNLIKLNIVSLNAVTQLTRQGNKFSNNLIIQNCAITGPGSGVTGSDTNINNGVSLDTDAVLDSLQSIPGSNGIAAWSNVSAPTSQMDFSNVTNGFGGQQNYVFGGIYGAQFASGGVSGESLTCSDCLIDFDTVFGQTWGIYGSVIGNFIGRIYLDANESGIVFPGSYVRFENSEVSPNTPLTWGFGTFEAAQMANITYPPGAGESVSIFTNRGGATNGLLFLIGTTTVNTFCFDYTTNAGARTCNNTLNPTTLDSTLGAFVSCVYAPGGGSICN